MTPTVRVVVRRFPLSRRYATASLEVSVREVAIVGLFEVDELIGVGEAAPLPGYSTETLAESIAAIRGFEVGDLYAATIEGDFVRARNAVAALPGSARAAIEAATLDAVARSRGESFAARLGRSPRRFLTPAVLADLDGAVDLGDGAAPGAIKLKIGRDLASEFARARALRARFPSTELRLDANRTLDPIRDREALSRFAELGIAFVEEPFASLTDSLAWTASKVALDESLRGLPLEAIESIADSPNVVALVLKPTSLGVLHTAACVDVARRVGRRAILSHGFEGPVGFQTNAALALGLVPEETHPGLDPDYGPLDAGVRPPSLVDGRLVPTDTLGLGMVDEVRGWF